MLSLDYSVCYCIAGDIFALHILKRHCWNPLSYRMLWGGLQSCAMFATQTNKHAFVHCAALYPKVSRKTQLFDEEEAENVHAA